MMNVPRCGMPDGTGKAEEEQENEQQPKKSGKKRRFKRYNLQGSVWPKASLSWKVLSYSQSKGLQGRQSQIDDLLKQAFSVRKGILSKI